MRRVYAVEGMRAKIASANLLLCSLAAISGLQPSDIYMARNLGLRLRLVYVGPLALEEQRRYLQENYSKNKGDSGFPAGMTARKATAKALSREYKIFAD